MIHQALECQSCEYDDEFGVNVIKLTKKQLKKAVKKFPFERYQQNGSFGLRVLNHRDFIRQRYAGIKAKPNLIGAIPWYNSIF